MPSSYTPPQPIINNYADVLVNYALNSGQGVKKNEVVQCSVPDIAKPLALAVQNSLLKAGAHPMVRLIPTEFDHDFFSLASDAQLQFFPKDFTQARVKLIDHSISIIADPKPFELKSINPQKIVLSRDSKRLYRDWLNEKEAQGKFTWTAALWGVEAKAKLVGLSLKAYWQQIIKACFLDSPNPVGEWRRISALQNKILAKLNQLNIEYLTVKGPDVELKVSLGADRIWQGGSGRNIPSFECFTSPDWRGVEGWMRYNQPVYRYGNVIQETRFEFKRGRLVKARAKRGNSLLQEMLKSPNADKTGEFSLTDKRMSRITHPMAEILYDENIGGPFGNSHLAIGMAYQSCLRGDQTKLSKKDWADRGFNDSAEHTDFISTTDRMVTAKLINGSELVIYREGQFVI